VLARAFEQWSLPAVTLAELLNRLDLAPANRNALRSVPDAFLTLRALLDTLSQSDIHRLLYSLEAEFRIERSVLDEFQPLNWEMLAEMSQAGMTIGSHTRTHARCSQVKAVAESARKSTARDRRWKNSSDSCKALRLSGRKI
jgi:hypothetical protein